MAGAFQVTPSALRDKAQELRAQNVQLKNQISSMKSQELSMRGMWEGDAHEAFVREFSKDITKMQTFADEIEKFATRLDQIAGEYETAEITNTQVANTRLV